MVLPRNFFLESCSRPYISHDPLWRAEGLTAATYNQTRLKSLWEPVPRRCCASTRQPSFRTRLNALRSELGKATASDSNAESPPHGSPVAPGDTTQRRPIRSPASVPELSRVPYDTHTKRTAPSTSPRAASSAALGYGTTGHHTVAFPRSKPSTSVSTGTVQSAGNDSSGSAHLSRSFLEVRQTLPAASRRYATRPLSLQKHSTPPGADISHHPTDSSSSTWRAETHDASSTSGTRSSTRSGGNLLTPGRRPSLGFGAGPASSSSSSYNVGRPRRVPEELSYHQRVARLRKPAMTAADKLDLSLEERARIFRELRTRELREGWS